MKNLFFSKQFEETLKKAQLGYDIEKFSNLVFIFSFVGSIILTGFTLLFVIKLSLPYYSLGVVFVISFILLFLLIKSIPTFAVQNKRAELESDLLYSTRHLLLKLESGSSLLNALESVSKLKTKSSMFFKEIMYDVSLGMPTENALEKAIEYSPSKAFTKIMEEIQTSLSTGVDLQKTLKSTLKDVTKQHLIAIQEYGKKLNPMSMFYMIIGTIVPSLGTSMIVVATSLLPGAIIIDRRILMFIAALLLVIQIFFILGFKSLKPMVIE